MPDNVVATSGQVSGYGDTFIEDGPVPYYETVGMQTGMVPEGHGCNDCGCPPSAECGTCDSYCGFGVGIKHKKWMDMSISIQ